MFIFPKKKKRN